MNKQKPKLERKYVYVCWMVIFCSMVLISSLFIEGEHSQNIYYQGMLLFLVIVGSAMIGYSW